MTALNQTTRRRLSKLRQIPSVWEGDRRSLASGMMLDAEPGADVKGECVLWVDGTEALVRAMDVVPPESGPEAVVRALLRAMEFPHSSTKPARPQKIVVRDRELQFFLRGVLQGLDINVDYAPELPLIDEIFRGLQEVANNRPPELPPEFVESMTQLAHELWNDAPWDYLDEEKILAVELNYGDIGTLYISVLGMLGMEFGILMYRSIESLQQFRQKVLSATDNPKDLEAAFLEQDCFFLTYDQSSEFEEWEEPDTELVELQPSFGNLHPLEGMRPVLYEEEAPVVLLALGALHRFFQKNRNALDSDHFPELSDRYRLPDPHNAKKKISVTVSTLPTLAAELADLTSQASLDAGILEFPFQQMPVLRNDLVPRDVFYSLGAMSWDILECLRNTVKFHQHAADEFPTQADGFPVILIQASRPKAMALIEGIQTSGGLDGICFNPGEDSISNQNYDLGIFRTGNGDLHLFGEFIDDDPVHVQARKKWDQRCKKTKGHCGLVIAKGLKGANRGNPDLNDMLALFEVRSFSTDELGLGKLELLPQF